ncbi:hypothetical protein [Phyllobacterium sp. K27]
MRKTPFKLATDISLSHSTSRLLVSLATTPWVRQNLGWLHTLWLAVADWLGDRSPRRELISIFATAAPGEDAVSIDKIEIACNDNDLELL